MTQDVAVAVALAKDYNKNDVVIRITKMRKYVMKQGIARLFLIVLIAFFVVGCGNNVASSADEKEEREERERDDEDEDERGQNEAEREDAQEDIMGETSVDVAYPELCIRMLEADSAYGSEYEEMAVKMAKTIAASQIMSVGENYCMTDIPEDDKSMLMYALGCPNDYSLIDYREEVDVSATDGIGIVYKKDDYQKLVEAFCEYEINYPWVIDYGDYVGLIGADGAPWVYFDAYDIKEEGPYVLVHAACFMESNGGDQNVYQYTINVLLEKNEESVLGMQALYVEAYENRIADHVISVLASSQLADYHDKSYGPENLLDHNHGTPWVEGADGVGVGESVQIKLDQKTYVQEFVLYNGYQETEELFYKNGCVAKVVVDFGNGVVREMDCQSYYCGPGMNGIWFDKISLEQPVLTDVISIRILEANAGEKYSDTCISEIGLY